MPDIRAIKAKARRNLHEILKVPAFYRASAADGWVRVNVRPHVHSATVGDVPGLELAETRVITPRIIFFVEEVALPKRGSIVSIAANEAYVVGDCDPQDGLTITAHVSPVPINQTTPFPIPVPPTEPVAP